MSQNINESATVESVSASSTNMHQPQNSNTQITGSSKEEGDPANTTSITDNAHIAESTTRDTTSSDSSRLPYGPVRTDTTTALQQSMIAPLNTPPPIVPISQRTRAQSTAIGPSTDLSDTILKEEEQEQSGPKLDIALLLTNGARHPFILDARYLAKRNVEVQGNDPYNLSVYKLKELILREWREEWEQKPSSPSYIRLISFGKLLDDKSALKDLKFKQTERNVIHMTIKPQDIVEDDDGKGPKAGFSSGRGGEDGRSPGCRCVIM